jgi:pimeloyl-ACP methyl ester carboxylesterase
MAAALLLMGASLLAASPVARPDGDPSTGYVEIGDARLYYEETGEGPSLVLLHGGFLDARMWDSQAEAFAPHFRVIRYDARNHGRSKGVPGEYTHYEDLLALLDQLEIPKAHLVGLSLGGRTIIDFAIAHPDRVSALVLASPGAGGYEFRSEALKRNGEGMRQAFEAGDLARVVEHFQRSWTDGPGRSPEDVDPVVRNRVRDMALATVEAWNLECVAKDLAPPAIGRLDEIQARALVVLGELDMPGILEIGEAIARDAPGARVVTIEGAAHMVNLEAPGDFNRLVLQFLATSGAVGADAPAVH